MFSIEPEVSDAVSYGGGIQFASEFIIIHLVKLDPIYSFFYILIIVVISLDRPFLR